MDPMLTNFNKSLNINASLFVPSEIQEDNKLTQEQILNKDDDNTENEINLKDESLCKEIEESVEDDWESNVKSEKIEEEDKLLDNLDDVGESKIKLKKKEKEFEKLDFSNKKEHYNIVFIGHVDAGKSTIGGQLLYLTGQVDKRTLEKYEKEAKDKNRESWYLSWALDTNPEERDKGKTVEVGRAYFETENKNFTLLDAPGHKGFVPNMISGTSQADLAVLVISARKGEFETGFERGGQTREHAMLAKTSGVKHLIVLVNKMDDSTVKWNESRFNECRDKLLPYLRKCGFNSKTEVFFIPCSGLHGYFLKDCPQNICPWYKGPSFLTYIDQLASLERNNDGPFRMPVVDKYKDMGTVIYGKIESGTIRRGQNCLLMPNRKEVEVLNLWNDEVEVNACISGENIKIKLKGVEEDEVTAGFVLCDLLKPCSVGRIFDAQVVIFELKSIICPGYSAVLHMHTAVEEITIRAIICLIDKKTGQKSVSKPRFVKQDQVAIMRLECVGGLICMEAFKEFSQLGRFTLRDEGKTIAIGKVLKVVD